MADDLDYGLGDALAALEAEDVTRNLCDVIRHVRRQNADRHEPLLGDDALTIGFANWRNVGNLLERRYDGDRKVKPVRPDNSFQLQVGVYTVSVYGLSAADPTAITWRGSGVKMRLAEGNSAAVGEESNALTLDEALREAGHSVPSLRPTRLVFVHWADPDASRVRIWAGFPRNNERGGPPWLAIVEITEDAGGSGEFARQDGDAPPTGFRDLPMPDPEVGWAPEPAEEPEEEPGA
jgi:hypothetical protein